MFGIACALVSITGKYSSPRIYFGGFSIICFLFLAVLLFIFKKTNRLSNTALPVKSNLQTISAILNEYVKRYFQLTMGLIPVSIAASFLLAYNDKEIQSPFSFTIASQFWGSIFFLAFLILFTVGMYYFTKWYLKKLYGNYIDQLQLLIKELGE